MDRSIRSARRRGFTRALVLVAVILIGGAAAAGVAVLSLLQAGGSTTTSSTSVTSPIPAVSTTSTSTSLSVAASSSTVSLGSSSTSSIPCPLNSTGTADMAQLNATIGALVSNLTDAFNQGPGNATAAQLFGNFTQMTVTSDITGKVSLATSSSYQVVGRPMIGSLEYFEVNFTTSTPLFNESQVVMFAPNGTATSVSSPILGNFTAASAGAMGEGDVSTFLIQLHSSAYAKSIESDPSVAVLNSTTVSLGPTQVKMTYYTLKSAPTTYCGTTVKELVEGLGTVQKTGLTMLMYSQTQVSAQGTTVGITTSVESLTLAGP